MSMSSTWLSQSLSVCLSDKVGFSVKRWVFAHAALLAVRKRKLVTGEADCKITTVPNLSLVNLGVHARLSLRFPGAISLAGPPVLLSSHGPM